MYKDTNKDVNMLILLYFSFFSCTGLDLSFGPPGPGSVMDISDELLNSTTSSTSDALALQKSVIGKYM